MLAVGRLELARIAQRMQSKNCMSPILVFKLHEMWQVEAATLYVGRLRWGLASPYSGGRERAQTLGSECTYPLPVRADVRRLERRLKYMRVALLGAAVQCLLYFKTRF